LISYSTHACTEIDRRSVWVILADEPTGEVDTKTRELIINILRQLSESGQTVVIVTHDPWVAERTDRTIKLVDGKVEGSDIN